MNYFTIINQVRRNNTIVYLPIEIVEMSAEIDISRQLGILFWNKILSCKY